jgi:hypothetical protein
MFDYDQGLGPGKWLKWFMVAMILYAISTFWPDNRIAVFLGGGLAALGVSLAVHQIRKGGMRK